MQRDRATIPRRNSQNSGSCGPTVSRQVGMERRDRAYGRTRRLYRDSIGAMQRCKTNANAKNANAGAALMRTEQHGSCCGCRVRVTNLKVYVTSLYSSEVTQLTIAFRALPCLLFRHSFFFRVTHFSFDTLGRVPFDAFLFLSSPCKQNDRCLRERNN